MAYAELSDFQIIQLFKVPCLIIILSIAALKVSNVFFKQVHFVVICIAACLAVIFSDNFGCFKNGEELEPLATVRS